MADSTQNFSIPAYRQRYIANYVDENGSITIKEAATLCAVSDATIRRDLDEMSENSILVRTRGGAVKFSSTGFKQIQDARMKVMVAEKKRIASVAAKLVHEAKAYCWIPERQRISLRRSLQTAPTLPLSQTI